MRIDELKQVMGSENMKLLKIFQTPLRRDGRIAHGKHVLKEWELPQEFSILTKGMIGLPKGAFNLLDTNRLDLPDQVPVQEPV